MPSVRFLTSLGLLASMAIAGVAAGVEPVDNKAVIRRHAAGSRRAASCKNKKASAGSSSSQAPAPTHAQQAAVQKPTSSSSKPASTQHASTQSGSGSGAVASSPGWGPFNKGKKRGLCWPNGDSLNIGQYLQGGNNKVNWYYSWTPNGMSNNHGLAFCPMLWGYNQISQFEQQVIQRKGDVSAKCVFGMNEPNEQGQSNMSPQQGIQLWQQYIEPLHKDGFFLVSPAPSSRPNGFDWVGSFLKGCNGCHVDAIAVHYYDVSAQGFIAFINKFHSAYNKPIIVTEYACQNFNGGAQCSASEIKSFMATTMNYMDSQDWVLGYAWFAPLTDMQGVNQLDALMTGSGSLTDLAWQFVSS